MKERIKTVSNQEPIFMENKYSSYLQNAVAKLRNGGASHVTDKEKLIAMLKDAFCEEMNAWYQYIIVAPFVKGNERSEIVETLLEQAKDEYEDHALWLLDRINLLGGDCSGIDSPDSWNRVATHKYIIPNKELTVQSVLKQNIEAERGAIETYRKLEKFTRDIDPVSNDKIKDILADEEEHLQNLLEYLDDING